MNLTLSALKAFGADVEFVGEYRIEIRKSKMHACAGRIEGDYSNAAFLDAFNHIGSHVQVGNLKADSLQGDRVYRDYFRLISEGTPTLDISDCPDLGPILFAVAAVKGGGVFTGTKRLKIKESDRGEVMKAELSKFGAVIETKENETYILNLK